MCGKRRWLKVLTKMGLFALFVAVLLGFTGRGGSDAKALKTIIYPIGLMLVALRLREMANVAEKISKFDPNVAARQQAAEQIAHS